HLQMKNAAPIQYYGLSKQYLSLIICYLTAFFFGFHLTGIEMIRNHYFEKNSALRSTFYIIAAIPFAVPILSGLLRPFIHLKISQWLCAIHCSNMIAFGLYTTGQVNMLYLARFFTGLGMGLSTNVVPEYVGQLDPSRRGLLTYLFQTSIIVGIVSGQVATIVSTKTLYMNMFFFITAALSFIAAICSSMIIPVTDQGTDQQNTSRKTLLIFLKKYTQRNQY
ncbi:Major Facilitator Superfamily (MFS), partial [Pseudoloma neurophilia]